MFTRAPCVWEQRSGAGLFVPLDKSGCGLASDQGASNPLAQRLAAEGVTWYALLPLALPQAEEGALVALGAGHLPPLAERSRVLWAGALLGDLVTFTLEHARLVQLLASQDHEQQEFIHLASHELKSPLTVIKGYSQLLLRQTRRAGPDASVNVSGLETISQQVNRMSTLVGELLDFSRIERGTLVIESQPVDVVALVSQMVEQRQHALPEMRFTLAAREPQLVALADRLRLEQVVGYLLDNAIKFGQDAGLVEITVQRAPSALLPSSQTCVADGGQTARQGEVALISVRDYGPGLPPEEQARLFTPFYRGPEYSFQRQFAGLGLGLYLSHYLVERQNGLLWAEFPFDNQTAGGIFSLALPLAPAS